MADELTSRVRADFSRARFKAFLNRAFAAISGQPTTLLSYDEIKQSLHIGGPIYRGVHTVRVDQIVGSLNRYHEFDRAFLPAENQLAARWQNIDSAFYKDISLPPVVLYKVGQVYFVVDGHHRVSVARQQGQEFIEAEVRECSTKVNITPDLKTEDLKILHEKVHFLERTGLDDLRPKAKIRLTHPGWLRPHVGTYRRPSLFYGTRFEARYFRARSHHALVRHGVFPYRQEIRKSKILKDFPGKTEGDLYLVGARSSALSCR